MKTIQKTAIALAASGLFATAKTLDQDRECVGLIYQAYQGIKRYIALVVIGLFANPTLDYMQ
jgi:hypothetical protein